MIDQVLNDWDQQGRLAAVSFDDDADGVVDRRVDYKSDDGGLRVSRTETGVETKLLWDHTLPYGQVLAEYVVGDEDATVRYTFGHQVISQERVPYANWDPFTYFYHQDGHSGVRQMARGFAGQLLIFDAYAYDAFGVLLNPEASASTPNTRQYRGEMRDPTTGLIDLRARPTYDPTTGRFGSEDPFEGILTNPITRHRFLYAGADPVNHADPTGMLLTGALNLLGSIMTRSVLAGAAVSAGTAIASAGGYWRFGANPVKGGLVGAELGAALSIAYSTRGGVPGVSATLLRGLVGGVTKWISKLVDIAPDPNAWNGYTWDKQVIDGYEGFSGAAWAYSVGEWIKPRVGDEQVMWATLATTTATQLVNEGTRAINGEVSGREFIKNVVLGVVPGLLLSSFLDHSIAASGKFPTPQSAESVKVFLASYYAISAPKLVDFFADQFGW